MPVTFDGSQTKEVITMSESKKSTTETKEIQLNPIREGSMILTIVGDSNLILCAKARSYEREEIFKHPLGEADHLSR